jgi:hypothetical protein
MSIIRRILRSVWIRRPLKLLAASVLLVAAPLLAFGEATIKSLIDGWLSECLLVVESDRQSDGSTMVRLYPFGKMPASLPLTFSSSGALLERISFLHHVEQAPPTSITDLAVHPQAGQRCPGELCADHPDAFEKVTIRINSLTPNFVYRLRVLFKDHRSDNQLRLYVLPKEIDRLECRVESASPTNYFARLSTAGRVATLSIAIPLLVVLVAWLRSAGGH